MAVYIRAYGENFDVDLFLSVTSLPISRVHKKGESLWRTKPHGEKKKESGVNIKVSEAYFDELPQQIADAENFLLSNREELIKLCSLPGVVNPGIEFGIENREAVVQTDEIPLSIVRLAAEIGLSIAVSKYVVSEEDT